MTKIVKMMYCALYQGLSKRQCCKEHVGRKLNNAPGVKLRQNISFVHTCFFSPRVIIWLKLAIKKHWLAINLRKHTTSMSSKPEPAIWSHDTGLVIPCFDSCLIYHTMNVQYQRCPMVMVLFKILGLAKSHMDIQTVMWQPKFRYGATCALEGAPLLVIFIMNFKIFIWCINC